MLSKMMAGVTRRWSAPGGYREVLGVSLPLVAGMASTTVMEFTDRLFLSHYSVEAIAAATPAAVVHLLFLLTCMGITGYAGVFIAQYIGSGAPHRVGVALWQGLLMAFFFGACLALLWFAAPAIFAFAGHLPAVQAGEMAYFRMLALGSVLALGNSCLGGFFSGQGRTRPVMLANFAAMAVHIPLDYALIYGAWGLPEMGIEGAGLSMILSWAVTSLLLGGMVFTPRNERCFRVWSGRGFERALFLRMARYGLPSGINGFAELFSVTWFVFLVGELGETALAATNITFSINMVAFLPMMGMNIAVGSMVGQAMGKGSPSGAEQVTSSTLHVAMAWMLLLSLFFFCMPGPLYDLFLSGGAQDPAVLAQKAEIRAMGVVLLRFVAVYCLLDAVTIVYTGALKGAGDTWFVMWNMLLGCLVWLVLPTLVLRASGLMTLNTLWAAFTAFILLLAAMSWMRFRRGAWKRLRLVETAHPLPDAPEGGDEA
ncbi:MAG: MATE family efflux transporter [Desulfovibrio sp.]|jgi:MATE family multidrug resistance protein|nr:MATE family efflux transporter [Desulfovibrio sp.]